MNYMIFNRGRKNVTMNQHQRIVRKSNWSAQIKELQNSSSAIEMWSEIKSKLYQRKV